jgi:hypothetical protein
MTLDRVRDLLGALGPPVTPLELAEMLWLAAHLPGGDHATEFAAGTDSAGEEQASLATGSVEVPPDGNHGEGTQPLYLPTPGSDADSDADALLVPTAPMLGHVLGIQRALRPLKRRVPARQDQVLDEDATAAQIADRIHARPWVPVFAPTRERWLSLAIVLDTGPAMGVWRPLAEELGEAMFRLGAFRDVRTWYAAELAGQIGIRAGPRGPIVTPSALLDPALRQAVLLLSDCSGPHWWDGRMSPALHSWARHGPTAILQPLPERLWRRTAAPTIPGQAILARQGAPNTELRFTPHDGPVRRFPGTVPVPVAELKAAWLADWARLVAASGGWRDTAVTYLSGDARPAGRLPVRELELPVRDRVARFCAAASPTAAELAGHVAVTVPSLPVMRLIQRRILRSSRPSDLAELLLSGLLVPVDAARGHYDFVPGAREALLETLSRQKSLATADTLERISAEITVRAGTASKRFRAIMRVTTGTSAFQAEADQRPFAFVNPDALGIIARAASALDLGTPASGTSSSYRGHAFISCAREDSGEADELQRALEAAGIPVWRDTASLWPGEDWRAGIREAITDDALVFIACFSSHSAARQKSRQNEELLLAIEQLRSRRPDEPWLIPVRFDDCDIPDFRLGTGRTLASLQRADLFGASRDQETRRLVAAVQWLLLQPAPSITGSPDPTPEAGSVFISYAQQDARWAMELASRLRDYGLRVLGAWSMPTGAVVVHELDRMIHKSEFGIAVISTASLTARQARDEYTALVDASANQGLRLIPVLVGDVALPPFAASRVWLDFRNVHGQAYDDKVAELAAAILGRPLRDDQKGRQDSIRAGQLTAALPVTKPAQRAFVVCYAADDIDYSVQLIGRLRDTGLPTWSVDDLRPGDAYLWVIRQQLAHAIAIIVVMSPQSQDSDDITEMILEGQLHGRPFLPVLLHGDVNYQLAHTWYFDARDGRLPDADLLGMLRQLHEADAAGRQADAANVLPPPVARPAVRAVRVPRSAHLDLLDRYLGDREFEYADLLSTSLVLESANRLGEGWMRERDGKQLPLALIADIDALWSRHSGGRQGFQAQLALARVRRGRHAEFRALSVACGWQDDEGTSVSRHYGKFSKRANGGSQAGFFPTLRNPQSELTHDWYDRWVATVLAVHLRLQEW